MRLGLGLRNRYKRFPLVRFGRYAYLRRWDDYRRAPSAPCVRYIGWLGHRNIGDEALYQAFRSGIASEALVVPFEDWSPISWMAERRKADVVLGGGTLINVRAYLGAMQGAHALGGRVCVFGTGVADLEYWAQHGGRGRGDESDWVQALRGAHYLGVRGPRSLQWMRRHGFDEAEIVGDPAVSVAGPAWAGAGARVVGLNLGSHDPVQGSSDGVYEAALHAARELLARGDLVHFVPLHDIDSAAGAALARALDHPGFVVHPFDPDVGVCLERLRACRLVVGQRLHATVLACALGIPTLSLSYQPKCLDFLESIDCAALAVPTEGISGPALASRVHALDAELAVWHERLVQACDGLRERQRQRARDLGWARP